MDHNEQKILQRLDELLMDETIRSRIDPIVEKVKENLAESPQSQMSWQPLPLEFYGMNLPANIASSWVFLIRANCNTGAERHPNSHQRMISYENSGDIQIMIDGDWKSHNLVSEFDRLLEERWASIPEQTWHQVVTGNKDWVVVSFHTVPESELIEERMDENNAGQTKQKKYSDE
jgi:hypothetical protein